MPYSLYSKPYRQPSDLINDLKEKNLLFRNEEAAKKLLNQISYYHFKIYLHPMLDLQGDNPKNYHQNSYFESGVELYRFDEELKFLMFKAIAKIEVKLRSRLDHTLSQASNDAFWYLSDDWFFPDKIYSLNNIRDKISSDFNREKELYASNFRSKYYNDKHDRYKNLPPFWIASELLSLGQIYNIYSMLNHKLTTVDLNKLALEFGASSYITLVNWIRCIRDIRNICAHHSRLWNAKLGIPKNCTSLLMLQQDPAHRPYATIVVIQKILKTLQVSSINLRQELEALFLKYPAANSRMHQAGFPINWKENPLFVKTWNTPPIFHYSIGIPIKIYSITMIKYIISQ
jgi:abortive infection bacteriophage resistance protein